MTDTAMNPGAQLRALHEREGCFVIPCSSVGAVLARTAYGAFVEAAREITGEGSFSFAENAIGFAEMNAFFKPGKAEVAMASADPNQID